MAKNIKVNEIEYSIPTDWNDITLKQFQDYYKISNEDAKAFSKRIAVLTGIDVETIENSSVDAVAFIANLMSNVLEKLPTNEVQLSFEHKGESFQIHHNETISFGQFVDWDTIVNKGDIIENLATLIAIRTFSVNDNYNSKELNRRVDLFKDLPVNIAYAYASFFLNLPKVTERGLEYYGKAKAAEQLTMEALKHLTKSGDGWVRYTALRMIVYYRLIMLRHYLVMTFFFSFATLKRKTSFHVNSMYDFIRSIFNYRKHRNISFTSRKF